MLQSGKLEQLKTQPQLLTAALLPGGGEGGKGGGEREEQVKEERNRWRVEEDGEDKQK